MGHLTITSLSTCLKNLCERFYRIYSLVLVSIVYILISSCFKSLLKSFYITPDHKFLTTIYSKRPKNNEIKKKLTHLFNGNTIVIGSSPSGWPKKGISESV